MSVLSRVKLPKDLKKLSFSELQKLNDELRDYTIEKEWLEQYVKWVKEFFLPYAKNKINIISKTCDI